MSHVSTGAHKHIRRTSILRTWARDTRSRQTRDLVDSNLLLHGIVIFIMYISFQYVMKKMSDVEKILKR